MFKNKGYFFTFVIIAHIYFLLSNIPLLNLIRRTPPGTTFPLFQPGQIPDYNGYLSAITLGQNGYWYFRNPYTTEKAIPGLFYIYYILIGKVSGLFHLWPPLAYHLARIFTVELFILSIFLLCYEILGKKYAFWASLLSIIGTISPLWLFHQKDAFITFTPWWSKFDAIQRLDGIPHHILGQALLLLSISFIILFQKSDRKIALFASMTTAFLAGIIFPPSIFPIIFALPLTLIILFILRATPMLHRGSREVLPSSSSRQARTIITPFILLFLTASVSLFISFLQTHQGYYKSVWVDWEVSRWNINEPGFNKDLFLVFGILPLISIPAIFEYLKSKSWEKIFIVLWAFLPFLLLPFVGIFSVSKIRLLGDAPFVPWGMLCAITIFEVARHMKSAKPLIIGILIIFLGISFATSARIFTKVINYTRTFPAYSNIFIPQSNWKLIDFAKIEIPRDSIILSDEYMGNLLPSYAPIISYFGHINLTYKFLEKQNNVWRFYTLRMDEEEAKEFVRINNIKYVYFGIAEKGLGSLDSLPFKFLKVIYLENDNIIYKVTK